MPAGTLCSRAKSLSAEVIPGLLNQESSTYARRAGTMKNQTAANENRMARERNTLLF
jgi:hypothetical protein